MRFLLFSFVVMLKTGLSLIVVAAAALQQRHEKGAKREY